MARKAKSTPNYVIKCCHCMTDEFKLTDVNVNEPPKDYTDTPAKFRAAQRQQQETRRPTLFQDETN